MNLLSADECVRVLEKLLPLKSKCQCLLVRWMRLMMRMLMRVSFVPVEFWAYNFVCRFELVENVMRRFDPLLQCLNNF